MRKLNLSFQDRFLLGFEREDLPFNSHFYFESLTPFDLKKIKETFIKQIELEPLLHVTCSYKTGDFFLTSFSRDVVEQSFYELFSEEEENDFLEKHFEFMKNPPIRVASLFKNHKYFIIFSFHHPYFDGAAQMNYLKDFFDIYQGIPYTPRSTKDVATFRHYLLSPSILWFSRFLWDTLKPFKNNLKTKISRLNDREPHSRQVEIILLNFDRKIIDSALRKYKLSTTAFFSLCAVRAIDQLQCERNEHKLPIVIYIPKNMRSELKAPRSFQNLIGIIWMKFSRERIQLKDFPLYFRNFYKYRSSHKEIRKVLFATALFTRLTTYKKLYSILQNKEKKIHDSTIVISSGRTPKEILLPNIFKEAKFYGRGTMFRSPGIGLMATSNEKNDFVCIEYLKDAFSPETIKRFSYLFSQEVTKEISDP